MPLKIVRNDIVNMETDAIVNTANRSPIVGPGCDTAIYDAAGYNDLLKYRIKNIGYVPQGGAFITPGFNLKAKFIIHAVSPRYIDGNQEEEQKLRSCYQKSLALAKENNIKSIAFPLISTGGFGYPKAEGLRIAVDEINAFLADNDMLVYIVVFYEDEKAKELSEKLYPDLEDYIDNNYVEEKRRERHRSISPERFLAPRRFIQEELKEPELYETPEFNFEIEPALEFESEHFEFEIEPELPDISEKIEKHEEPQEPDFTQLNERIEHLKDTFSQYLIFLIKNKNLKNSDVYKRAIIDRRVFSRIRNNIDYHPDKLTALCLCIGAKLNIDEAKDLLARAGYALSPCDMTDIIFSFFIEKEIYDMIELDIQLEEHGLPCIIS